jgi:hypothetical protein
MTTTTLDNKDIMKFQKILNTFSSTFLNTISNDGGLLSEINTITKKPNNLAIPKTSEIKTNTYNTAQFANFIRNILNFNIKNYDAIGIIEDTNMIHVKKTTISGVDSYSFNNNIKTHIIETLKVINVFVDILEAYKNCIDSEVKSANYTSGYTNEIDIHRIELVSNTTRFYTGVNAGMFPIQEIKNVGYIRTIAESNSSRKNVLFLSIESFYNDMNNPKYNYNNMFTKTNLQSLGSQKNIIINNILNTEAKEYELRDATVVDKTYARQIYSGVEHKDLEEFNLTLEERNKNLIVYLLKILFNLDRNFRKQSVRALYYYYKFIQLYSTLIINVSNVMYTNGFNPSVQCHCIETLNMSLMNMPKDKIRDMSRAVSGIEIKVQGKGYSSTHPPVITISGGGAAIAGVAAPTSTKAVATVNQVNGNIPINSIVNITNNGSGYINNPSITITAAPSVAGNSNATASITIIPIAIENIKNNEKNINTLKKIIEDISNSINAMNFEFTSYARNESDIFITISTSTSETGEKTNVSLATPNVLITITKPAIINNIKKLMSNDDIIKNYMVHDKINKYSYSILKIIENTSTIQITLNATFVVEDYPENNIDTKLFRGNDNIEIVKPIVSSGVSANVTYSKISNTTDKDFLEIKKKDLNTYKNEYINNRDDIERLDENIRINLNKVENQKNLYNTHYNKNLFLTRQIISYNTIIAAIIIILIVINMINVDQLFIKTTSLVCLGVVLLLFAVYFIANITYIETFGVATVTGLSDLDILKTTSFSDTNKWVSPPSQSEYNTDKLKILNSKISDLNKNFIGFFEKLIITLPTSDNVDFYKEVTGIITYDKDSKTYTNNVLLLNKDDAINNLDILKYEIENNKLYIMSLLIATIVFISIYNLYINYVSNDRFLSLTVFICVIILIVIASYYVIRSNRRVRTFYKNIYWGPETSVRF